VFSEVLRLKVKEKKRTGIQKALLSRGRQVLLPEPIYHFMSQEVMCCKHLLSIYFWKYLLKAHLLQTCMMNKAQMEPRQKLGRVGHVWKIGDDAPDFKELGDCRGNQKQSMQNPSK